MANPRFGLCKSCATIDPPASSACSGSAENWTDARVPSCFKVRKLTRTARLSQHGLLFPVQGPVIFQGCAARAALKAALAKGRRQRWIIGSNDRAYGALRRGSFATERDAPLTGEKPGRGSKPRPHRSATDRQHQRGQYSCAICTACRACPGKRRSPCLRRNSHQPDQAHPSA